MTHFSILLSTGAHKHREYIFFYPVTVNVYTSWAYCACFVTAALLTEELSDGLKGWFCFPAVLVYSSICHTVPCQLSQDGLTLVNDLVPYVGFHWLRLFWKKQTNNKTYLAKHCRVQWNRKPVSVPPCSVDWRAHILCLVRNILLVHAGN